MSSQVMKLSILSAAAIFCAEYVLGTTQLLAQNPANARVEIERNGDASDIRAASGPVGTAAANHDADGVLAAAQQASVYDVDKLMRLNFIINKLSHYLASKHSSEDSYAKIYSMSSSLHNVFQGKQVREEGRSFIDDYKTIISLIDSLSQSHKRHVYKTGGILQLASLQQMLKASVLMEFALAKLRREDYAAFEVLTPESLAKFQAELDELESTQRISSEDCETEEDCSGELINDILSYAYSNLERY